jgi:hypothetical protein
MPAEVTAADFNNDGAPDIAYAMGGAGGLAVCLNAIVQNIDAPSDYIVFNPAAGDGTITFATLNNSGSGNILLTSSPTIATAAGDPVVYTSGERRLAITATRDARSVELKNNAGDFLKGEYDTRLLLSESPRILKWGNTRPARIVLVSASDGMWYEESYQNAIP